MNFLQLKIKNRELAKEFKANYKLNKSDKDLEWSLFRSKIEDNIEVHFAHELDISENEGNKEYECVCYHKDTKLYEIIIPYTISHGKYYQDDKQISVTDTNGNSYDIDSRTLRIVTKDYNFKKSYINELIEGYLVSELNNI
jgi:hypothetical protein